MIMNIRAGLFRLWLVVSIFWVFGSALSLWNDLVGDCPSVADGEPNICELTKEFGTRQLIQPHQLYAIQITIGPPLVLLILGAALIWVGYGFSKARQ
jgi:hypothetical protein